MQHWPIQPRAIQGMSAEPNQGMQQDSSSHVPKDANVIIKAVFVVEHQNGSSTRLQNTEYLGKGSLRVRGVVKHSVRIDKIKALVGKRKGFRIFDLEAAIESQRFEVSARRNRGGGC